MPKCGAECATRSGRCKNKVSKKGDKCQHHKEEAGPRRGRDDEYIEEEEEREEVIQESGEDDDDGEKDRKEDETPTDPLGSLTQTMPDISGLFALVDSPGKKTKVITSLPLKAVKIGVTVVGPSARLITEQTYSNPTSSVLEVEYIWPIAPGAGVSDVQILLVEKKRRLKGVLFSRDEAEEKYEKAKKEGKFASRVNESSDKVLRLTIGNLLPNNSVVISIHQVMLTTRTSRQPKLRQRWGIGGEQEQKKEVWEMEDSEGSSRFPEFSLRIPTYISPRYQTNQLIKIENSPSQAVPVYTQAQGKGKGKGSQISFDIEFFSRMPLANFQSPSHPKLLFTATRFDPSSDALPAALRPLDPAQSPTSSPTPRGKETERQTFAYRIDGFENLQMDKDFVLLWDQAKLVTVSPKGPKRKGGKEEEEGEETSDEFQQSSSFLPEPEIDVYVERSPAKSLSVGGAESLSCLVNLVPGGGGDEEKGKDNNSKELAAAEYIFVLDRSGSMDGSRIESAKKALILFLKSLPPESYFNVLSFGSTFSLLEKQSVKTTDTNLKAAVETIKKFTADMGGTEIMNPLRLIFGQRLEETYDPLIPSSSAPSPSSPKYLAPVFPEKGKGKGNGKDKDRDKGVGAPLMRQVFVLTDGDVNEGRAIIDQSIGTAPISTRVFMVGIGDSANQFLLEEMAAAGRGASRTIDDQDIKKVNSVVVDLIRLSQSAAILRVGAEWLADGVRLKPENFAPHALSSLFSSQSYALGCLPPENCKVLTLRLDVEKWDPQKGQTVKKSFKRSWKTGENGKAGKTPLMEGTTTRRLLLPVVGQLMLQDLSRREAEGSELVAASLRTGVLSAETAFLIVDEKTSAQDVWKAQNLDQLQAQVPMILAESSPFRFGALESKRKAKGGRLSMSRSSRVQTAMLAPPSSAQPEADQAQKEKEIDFVVEIAITQSTEGYFQVANLSPEVAKAIAAESSVTKKAQAEWFKWKPKLPSKRTQTEETQIKDTIFLLFFLWFSPQTASLSKEWKLVSEKAAKWLNQRWGVAVTPPSPP